MARLEDELRVLLARKEPGPDFTAGVMRRLRDSGAAPAPVVKVAEFPAARGNFVTRMIPRRRWAMAGAIAAALAVGVFVGEWQDRLARQHRADMQAAEMREAEQAGQELMLSLQLAGAKMNKARDAYLRTVGNQTGGESQ